MPFRAPVCSRRWRAAPAAAAGRPQDADGVTTPLGSQPQPAPHQPTLLVAEDDRINQKIIVRQLDLLGIRADVAADGQIAIERWRAGGHDLVLTDLHMPNMDGYALTAAIRHEEARRGGARIPIVALTANALHGERQRALDAGMDEYLTKPLQLEHLRTALARWLPASTAASLGAGAARPQSSMGALAEPPLAAPTVLPEHDGSALAGFFSTSRELGSELEQAVRQHDLVRLARAARQLQSSARSVGAVELADRCREVADACEAGTWAQTQARTLPLRRELHAIQQEVGPWLAR